MSNIVPNSTIELFGDVGLSDNYTDTYYFPDENTKNSYFDSIVKVGVTTSPLTYLRKNENQIKVQIPMSSIYDARYMRFKNTSFENKWFYAFVRDVEYINNECSCVHYEIDPIMTWMGVFQLDNCFIERQHSETDVIGDNIIDEGIPCGDYVDESVVSSGYIGSNGFAYCFASTFDPTDPETNVQGAEYGGIYSGVKYSYTQNADTINEWISNATTVAGGDKSSGIVGIAIVPRSFITESGQDVVEHTQAFEKPYDGFGTDSHPYVPANNKLFIYPYKYLQVTNLEGNFAEFRYELFSGDYAQFEFMGNTGLSTEIVCSPLNYRAVQKNITEKMSMSDFPMCSYNVDAFKAYIAQNKSSIAANVLSSAQSLAIALAVPSSIPALTLADMSSVSSEPVDVRIDGKGAAQFSGLSRTIFGTLGQMLDYSRKPNHAAGAQGSGALFGRATGFQKKDFWFVSRAITKQYARIIDDYFTMFGYKQNKVATPNMHARTKWTYVKTLGCHVSGAVPADDAAFIEKAFDNGIRFWVSGNQIGVYKDSGGNTISNATL